MGAILPHDLLGGAHGGWLRVPVRQTPWFFLLQHHQGSHQYPSLPGHCYSVGNRAAHSHGLCSWLVSVTL